MLTDLFFLQHRLWLRFTIRKIKKYVANRKVDNLGISINTADVKKETNNSGINISKNIANIDRRINDLSLVINIVDKNQKAHNISISII